jgi:hypothetical protein
LFCVISDVICGNSGDDGCGGDDSSGDVRMRMRDWQQVGLLQKALLLLREPNY